ncbi:MAG TPA: riboflavin synthase [Planctomycetota bacterium]|nr:riboflavin synthase [Planctomycetota bacterium]
MFTGLIQHVGTILSIAPEAGGGARLNVDAGPLAAGAKLGDSIAIDGVCLTVVSVTGSHAAFDAVPETLRRTSLGGLKAGSRVNMEAALLPSERLGGHFVQGHVDTSATVTKTVEGGRWAEWHFKLSDLCYAEQIVEKGSIAIDGISLTVAGCDQKAGTFWVALIPETLARTTIGSKKQGAAVNIETDILGKYVIAALKNHLGAVKPPFGFDEKRLRENGY